MKNVFITGGSRGIGKAIAIRLAKEGYNIAVAAKTAQPHPVLKGTIYTAAEEINAAGGNALPLVVDVRSEEMVSNAIKETADTFGGIDIVINNASAINLSGTEALQMKRYDLMHHVNTRGTFLVSKYSIPYLKKSSCPHVLNLSPPLNMSPKWFGVHVAYTMAKYGMSMCVLGMAEEFKRDGIAFNGLWPKTTIATAAIQMVGGDLMMKASRKPEIMAEAAHIILQKESKSCTGNFFIDEDVLLNNGFKAEDLDQFAYAPGQELMPDLFLD